MALQGLWLCVRTPLAGAKGCTVAVGATQADGPGGAETDNNARKLTAHCCRQERPWSAAA